MEALATIGNYWRIIWQLPGRPREKAFAGYLHNVWRDHWEAIQLMYDPELAINAAINYDLRIRKSESYFVKTAPGTFALAHHKYGAGNFQYNSRSATMSQSQAQKLLGIAKDILTAEGKPLRYREIIDKAVEQKKLKTNDADRDASALNSALRYDIKKRADGRNRFIESDRGMYDLANRASMAGSRKSKEANVEAESRQIKVLKDKIKDLEEENKALKTLLANYLKR